MSPKIPLYVLTLIVTLTSVAEASKRFRFSDRQDNTGFYLGSSGGVVFVGDSTVTLPGVGSAEVTLDPGYEIASVFGYDWGNFLTELELFYQDSNLDTVGGIIVPGTVNFESFSYMANVLYEYEAGRLKVYLGGGIGGRTVQVSSFVFGLGFISSETDTQFAYQALTGLRVRLFEGLHADIGYRFIRSLDFEIDGFEIEAPTTHVFRFGFSYQF